jgi:hypothetical protein
MNTMNLPGFTAEASLYNSGNHDYRTSTFNFSVDSQAIQPAATEFDSSYDICGSCINGRQFCRGFEGGHLVYRGWFRCDDI